MRAPPPVDRHQTDPHAPDAPDEFVDELVDEFVDAWAERRGLTSTDGVGAVGDGDLLDAVGQLLRAQQVLDAALLTALGALDARGTTWADCGLRTASWLGAEHGLPRPVATRLTATARAARSSLDQIAPAVRDGRITLHHAAVLARLATPRVEPVVRACQSELIGLADGVRFEQWTREVQALVSAADPDGGHRPEGARDRARLRSGLGDSLHLDATFHGGTAQQVRAAIDDEVERRHRRHRELANEHADHQLPSHGELVAESLAELLRRGTSTRPGARPPVTDAIVVIHAGDPLAQDGSLGATAVGMTPDGVRLQDGTVRQLLCDAVLHPVVVDSLGVPLDLGRSVRAFSPAQRRAAMVRDGGCVHPGCDAPTTWTQLHHLDEVRLGGATDLGRSASLCPTHHAVWHSPGWSAQLRDDGHLDLTTPSGRQLVSQRHGRPPPGQDRQPPPGQDRRPPPLQ